MPKLSYNAPVVLTFSLIATLIQVLAETVWPEITLRYFAVRPGLDRPLDYFTLVSHIAGHGNWTHLFGNFTLILLIGPILEERHGSLSLLIMIAITALVTGLINVLFFDTFLLGASGIVFMLILLASTANIRQGEIPLTLLLIALLFLGKELVAALRDDNISQMAHLVGGAAGALFGFLSVGPRKQGLDAVVPSRPSKK
jgi:membrane associated rhomboid family serine protease